MANEPPCAILNEKYEIVSYDYTKCVPMACSSLCHRTEGMYVKVRLTPTIGFACGEDVCIPIIPKHFKTTHAVYEFKGKEFKHVKSC